MQNLNEIWLFNHPSPLGAPINGSFCGDDVDFPCGKMRSFPYTVGKELLNRYPFLSQVTDHPTAEGKLPPPPSGLKTAQVELEAVVEPVVENATDSSPVEAVVATDETPAVTDGLVEHVITQEDLDLNPELVAEGVQVGEVILLPPLTEAPENADKILADLVCAICQKECKSKAGLAVHAKSHKV